MKKQNATRKKSKPKKNKAKRGPGRPTKYTPERVEKIIRAIETGNYKTAAAKAAGIDPDTLAAWESRYPDFSEQIKEAEGTREVELVNVIEKASQNPRNWTAAAWLLERMYPDRWGKRERKDAGDGGAVERFVPRADGSFDRIAEGDTLIGHHNEPVDSQTAE